MRLLTAMVYVAQLSAAHIANRSPRGLMCSPSPWLKMMQAAPMNAISDPMATPMVILTLKKMAISMAVKMGEMEC